MARWKHTFRMPLHNADGAVVTTLEVTFVTDAEYPDDLEDVALEALDGMAATREVDELVYRGDVEQCGREPVNA